MISYPLLQLTLPLISLFDYLIASEKTTQLCNPTHDFAHCQLLCWCNLVVFLTLLHRLIEKYAEQMVVLADSGFHAKEGDPKNLKVCQRGSWNMPMVVETFNSIVTTIFGAKKMGHRVWKYVKARLSYVTAAFNILATWHGLQVSEDGMIHLSITEFSP
jgi:hypothetical protein